MSRVKPGDRTAGPQLDQDIGLGEGRYRREAALSPGVGEGRLCMLCRSPPSYIRPLRASWMEAGVMKRPGLRQGSPGPRQDTGVGRTRSKVRSTTPTAQQDDEAVWVVAPLDDLRAQHRQPLSPQRQHATRCSRRGPRSTCAKGSAVAPDLQADGSNSTPWARLSGRRQPIKTWPRPIGCF
jgi:hypothetical protein